MQAVILAAGRGERLRPLTDTTQKVMLPVSGKPFLEYVIRFLRRQNVQDIVVALAHQADQVRSFFGDGKVLDVQMRYTLTAEPTGTAGALRSAAELLQERFFVLNGDSLADVNLAAMLVFHQQYGFQATVALVSRPDSDRFGRVETSGPSITKFEEKRVGAGPPLINAGILVLERSVLQQLPTSDPSSLEQEVLPALAKSKTLGGYVFHGYFVDMGTPESYYRLTKESLPRALWTSV